MDCEKCGKETRMTVNDVKLCIECVNQMDKGESCYCCQETFKPDDLTKFQENTSVCQKCVYSSEDKEVEVDLNEDTMEKLVKMANEMNLPLGVVIKMALRRAIEDAEAKGITEEESTEE